MTKTEKMGNRMESSVRSRSAKFKLLRHFTAATALVLILNGCVTTPSQHAAQARTPQPLDHLVVAIPDADHDALAQLLAGEMALTNTDLKVAADHYGKAMLLSNDPQVAGRATQLAIAVHDDIAASRALDRWQALGASQADLAEGRAELALDQGDAEQAQKQLELLITSGDEDAWRRFGRVLVGARDQAQAGRLLEALATPERLPNDEHAWLAMSELGDKFGRQAYARRIADAAVKRFATAETYAWAAQQKYTAGDKEGARTLLHKALLKSPKDPQLRVAYASMLSQAGEYREAGKLLEHGPQTSQTYALRVALAAQGKDDKALSSLYRQMQSAPEDVREQNAFLLGQLATMQNRNDEALDWYSQVGDDDPHAFDADLRSALILYDQGKHEDAHRLLDQIELDYLEQPDQLSQAYQVDAELLLREQKYPEAEHAFSRALQVKPNDPGLLYGRGLVYAEAGNIDAAVQDFEALLKIKPGDVDASNALGYTLADANRDLPEAERLIQVARQAKPDDPAIADSWGWLQYRLGNLDKAATVLRAAWLARKDADVGVHLGEVLWKQGNHAGAQQVFNEVRKLDPRSSALAATLKRLNP